MSQITPFDALAVQKLDKMYVTNFMTSIAGVLREFDLISEKDCDNLRILLSTSSSLEKKETAHKTYETLLQDLLTQKSEFLEILLTRYGRFGLAQNLTRYSLRPVISQICKSIAASSQSMMNLSKLYFNRPFYVFLNRKCEKRVLFPSFLIHFSEKLFNESQKLLDIEEFTYLSNHQMAGHLDDDTQIDMKICESLNFQYKEDDYFNISHEDQIIKKVFTALTAICSDYEEFLSILRQNSFQIDSWRSHCDMQIQLLKNEIKKLYHSDYDNKEFSLYAIETKRMASLSTLYAIQSMLAEMPHFLELDIREFNSPENKDVLVIPEDIRRRLEFHLVSKSIGPAVAKKAVDDLIQYCIDNNTQPQQIIPGEVERINASLSLDTLQVFQTLTESLTTNKMHALEKTRAYGQTKAMESKLAKFLISASSLAGALILCFYTAIGCGVKTPPKSSIIDSRPALPFEELPASLDNSNDSSKKEVKNDEAESIPKTETP